MTDENKVLDDVANDKDGDPEKIMVKIDKVLKRVKYEVFGKVKVKFVSKADKELKDLHLRKQSIFLKSDCSNTSVEIADIDSKIADTLATKQRNAFQEELSSLLDIKRNRGVAAATFQLKERVVGAKSLETEAVSVIDQVTGVAANTAVDIRQASLNYCVDLLTNREPTKDFEPVIAMKKSVHALRMIQRENFDEYEMLSLECFEATYNRLSKTAAAKYPFIMRAGESFNLCSTVWQTEELPSRWCKSTLVQIYKGSGPRNNFQNQRFIHMKDEFPKFFGNLVMAAAKEKLIENMSKYQIGAKPGHRAQEHLFIIKSVISLYVKYDKSIILSAWDISKFFDKECLSDVMGEIYKNNVRGKLYRLLYLMNRNTRISVQTPVGMSGEMDTGEGLGQGTIEGAIASSISLDNGVRDYFKNSEDEAHYHGLPLGPLLFQDDVLRLSLDVNSAQLGNSRMEQVAESKLLNFNLEKSCYVVIGKERRRLEKLKELSQKPIQLCGKNMVHETSVKYLGDIISEKGLADSVTLTINKRKGLVIKAIYDIRCVIDDCRSHTVGGLVAGINMWEQSVLPMILYNSETWQEMSKKDIDTLEKLQLRFLRTLLAVGTGCQIPLLYSESGMLLMESEYWRRN